MMPLHTFILALLLSLFLSAAAQAQESLQLTFGQGQAGDRLYSSRAFPSLRAQAGSQVILQRSRGTDYRVEAAPYGRTWFQVQEVPAAETYIAVTAQTQGDQVTLEIRYSDRTADNAVSLATTVSGGLGEWIPLVQPAAATNGKRYNSSTAQKSLAIRVDRAP